MISESDRRISEQRSCMNVSGDDTNILQGDTEATNNGNV